MLVLLKAQMQLQKRSEKEHPKKNLSLTWVAGLLAYGLRNIKSDNTKNVDHDGHFLRGKNRIEWIGRLSERGTPKSWSMKNFEGGWGCKMVGMGVLYLWYGNRRKDTWSKRSRHVWDDWEEFEVIASFYGNVLLLETYERTVIGFQPGWDGKRVALQEV